MYYHGTKNCNASPFAHSDKYTFWVYPTGSVLFNKWDTISEAGKFCNHHMADGPSPISPRLKQYVCLGHKSIEDMAAARTEWASRKWNLDVAVEQEQEAEVPEVAAVAAVPAVAASAALHAQLLKTVEDMKDRLDFLEYKVRLLSQNEEENWSSERFINIWLCMYACLYITIPFHY
jgi:hypothetical protein